MTIALPITQVFPNLYLWVTYGVTILLERLWKEHAIKVAVGQNVSPYAVELCCALERALAYAYTGNAKVLSRGLLDPLFISRSLLEFGLPTINTNLVKILGNSHDRVVIKTREWPTSTSGPLTCSQGSHLMRYGPDSWLVSIFTFSIQIADATVLNRADFLPALADVRSTHPRRILLSFSRGCWQ